MITKLPPWVEIGGFVLAVIAGGVNAIALLGFNHQGVSHLSGSSTLLGVEIASTNVASVLHLLSIIASFVLGAAVSGFAIGDESLKLGRRYGAALIVEAALLVTAAFLLEQRSMAGHYLASAACGLQNALTTTYSGAVVRTTHVTGLFTDLGVTLGLRLRGRRVDGRRIVLYLTLICGFIVGGIMGAVAFFSWQFRAMFLPALLCLVLAVTYFAFRYRTVR